jgi:hypothetical protein
LTSKHGTRWTHVFTLRVRTVDDSARSYCRRYFLIFYLKCQVTPTKMSSSTSIASSALTSGAKVQPVGLTVADLQTLARVIEVASLRGTFRIAEYGDVKTLYDKLKMSVTAEEGEEQDAVPEPTVTADDLRAMYVLVDTISQRNGFRLEEFDIVKSVHDRLTATLEGFSGAAASDTERAIETKDSE